MGKKENRYEYLVVKQWYFLTVCIAVFRKMCHVLFFPLWFQNLWRCNMCMSFLLTYVHVYWLSCHLHSAIELIQWMFYFRYHIFQKWNFHLVFYYSFCFSAETFNTSFLEWWPIFHRARWNSCLKVFIWLFQHLWYLWFEVCFLFPCEQLLFFWSFIGLVILIVYWAFWKLLRRLV